MKASAVIYVKSVEPMRRFYEQLLGWRVASSTQGYCTLDSDSISLSLVAVPEAVSATIHIETPPRRRTNVPVKLAFPVSSIADARTIASSHGGHVDPSNTEWSHRGVIHCDGMDPEGNVIQLISPAPPDLE